MLGGNDLIVRVDGEEYGFVLNPDDNRSVVHSTEDPNVPLNTGVSTPTQAGGVYDVRDSAGDKAITHLDWSGGAGQKSLDTPDAGYSRFLLSRYLDTSIPGQISQQRPFSSVHVHNLSGPMFSALGKLWYGKSDGSVLWSADNGANWTAVSSWTGTAPATTISSFASDGTKLYISCSGAVPGLWVWNGVGAPAFTKFTGISAALERLTYNGGTLYGATGDGAGTISTATTGTYTEETDQFITGPNSTVALVNTQNAVYWVVSSGENSYVYKMTYEWGLSTPGVITEQFAEFPTGFVATCALGYLGNVDVGGYFRSHISGAGQGAVYRTANDGEMSILFRVGDRPEDTPVPTADENDNRIRACVAGGLDTYWLTERELLRWDLRSGGYVHEGDFIGCGAPSRVTTEAQADTLPTGGDEIKTVGEYRVHIFRSSGSLVTPSHRDSNGNIVTTVPMDYLLVAGGGGGGTDIAKGGGGGAGGKEKGAGKLFSGTTTVTIGNGGAVANNGQNTTAVDTGSGNLTAVGGGAGGTQATAGGNGGSGGGAGIGTDATDELGGTPTAGQGNDGGKNVYYGACGYGAAGGGGGADEVGEAGLEEVPS